MKKTSWLLMAAVCASFVLFAFAPGAKADQIVFTASMSGLNENPPNNTSGTGFAEVTLDTVLDTITVNLTWSGLTGPAAAGHIHGPAPAGTNAPVLFPFAITNTVSGTFNGIFAIDALQISWLEDGLLYTNLHTSLFPGGEIRGQLMETPVTATPEASSMLLLAAGLGIGLAVAARKNIAS